jgi:drug/metabolite transporter (DMT)-like permease
VMLFSVMIIVLLAALLHATWNFLVKATDDKYLSMSAVVIGHAPFAMVAMLNRRAVFCSLMTGGFIAAYSLVDGTGARQAGTALGFYGLLSVINALIFALIMRYLRPGTIKKVFSEKYQLALKGGGISFFAYAIVIWAFTQAPIALVTALRETSIIFAMLLGIFILKERFSLVKVIATIFILLGMVMLRLNI